MAKISELIYDVREAVNQYSDDSELDNRYIQYLYNIKRSKYLRRELNNYQRTTDISAQQTFCIPLEEVSASECSVDFDCEKILRSTKKIPKPIDLHTKVAINRVKPTTLVALPFNFITKERAPYIANAPFSQAIYSFYDPNGYIYVYSKSNISVLECLTITGVFENPLDLKDFKNCCDCDDTAEACFDEDTTEYPLQAHLIDVVKNEIINELIRKEQIPEDRENDATDS